MPTLAAFLNAPTEVAFKGKTYKLRQPSQLEQAQYATWLETRAREAAGRAVDLPEGMQRDLLRDVNADIAAGVYDWNGEVCARSLRTPVGLAKLVSIILADQAFTLGMAEEMVNDHLREIAAVLASKATDDPKALGAALSALGLPSDYFSRNSSTRRSTKRSKKSRR